MWRFCLGDPSAGFALMVACRVAISGHACDARHIRQKAAWSGRLPLAWRIARTTRLMLARSSPLSTLLMSTEYPR